MNKDKQFAVLGLGRFGQSLAYTLFENGCNVLACDHDYNVVQEFSSCATHVVQVDITDENAVEALGLGNYDVVIIATGSDMNSSIMATLIAKEKGAKYVIARAENLLQKKIFEKIGADRVVLPELEMGIKFATGLITSNLVDYINLSEEYSIAEINAIKDWFGKSIFKLNIRAKFGLNIIGIKRKKKMIVLPEPKEIICEGDILIIIGLNTDIEKVSANKENGEIF